MHVQSTLTDDDLIEHFRAGLNDREIGDLFGVTRQAVQSRRKKLGLERNPVWRKVNELVKYRWEIYLTPDKDSHNRQWPIMRLREWLRYRYGDNSLSPQQLHLSRSWVIERIDRDEVLCYDKDGPQPWYYRPRRPEDGRLLIDWPTDLAFPTRRARLALEVPKDLSNLP